MAARPAGPADAANVARLISPVNSQGDTVLLAAARTHRHVARTHRHVARTHRHVARTHRHVARTPRQIARAMLPHFGWSAGQQFQDLNLLWQRESGWSEHAQNSSSGAYGIPQALPGSKMASAGPRWWSNATTQIRWGLRYIKARYGSPRSAWSHSQALGWY
jgi:hypothetical protein